MIWIIGIQIVKNVIVEENRILIMVGSSSKDVKLE